MAETTPAIGLSVGASYLVAVTADHAVARRPVLTLHRGRSPEFRTHPESPAAGEPGLVIADFVDRVGDSGPVVADDGSAHRAEQLLADALHALAYIATGGRPLPSAVAVTHPAHWSAVAVEALCGALGQVAEWSRHQVSLVSDVAAALTALRASPGLPTAGIIALCDFGGSGSSITLIDAADDYRPVAATVRHTGFSGELIDRALLNHVVDDLTAGGSLDAALAAGSLTRLRDQCRRAKERLSANTVAELSVDVPGFHGDVWLTRAELDGAIREPLEGFALSVEESLRHNRFQTTGLSALAAVGGGANIPAITTGLAQRFGVTVISPPRPHLLQAIGVALRAAHGVDAVVTVPPAVEPSPTAPRSSPLAAPLAHTEFAAPHEPTPVPSHTTPIFNGSSPTPPGATPGAAPMTPPHRPGESEPVEDQPFTGETGRGRTEWYRRPLVMILACAAAVLILGATAVIALRHKAASYGPPPTVTSETQSPTSTGPPSPPPSGQHPVFPEVPSLPPLPTIVPPPEAPVAPAVP